MALVYTAEKLLDSIRNSGTLNNAKAQGTDDPAFLKYVNEVVRSKVVPQILRVQEDYLVQSIRVPLTSGKTKYRIPLRAIGQQLRDFAYVDASGNRRFFGSQPVRREELPSYNGSGGTEPAGYYIEGPYVRLVPTIGNYAGQLEYAFFCAPSALVLEAETRKIVTVNTGTGIVTLNSPTPADWSTSILFDVHAPWAGAELKVFDAAASQVGGVGFESQITFSTAIDGSQYGMEVPVAVGDYVTVAGESALLQIPEDLIPLVIEAVVAQAMGAAGDGQAIAASAARMKGLTQDSLQMLENRTKSKPMRVGLEGSILSKVRFGRRV